MLLLYPLDSNVISGFSSESFLMKRVALHIEETNLQRSSAKPFLQFALNQTSYAMLLHQLHHAEPDKYRNTRLQAY